MRTIYLKLANNDYHFKYDHKKKKRIMIKGDPTPDRPHFLCHYFVIFSIVQECSLVLLL